MPNDVRFRLLGPVTVVCDGRGLALDSPTAKAVLAVLLLRGEAGISTEDLIGSVWGGPGGATRDSVYHYISTLRAALRPAGENASIVACRPGYRLVAADDAVDWRVFRRLASGGRRARDAGDLDKAATLLDEAVGLWHGAALADVGERLRPIRRDMTEARLSTVEDLAAVETSRGNPQRAADLLREESASHPGRERAAELLVDALSALGRRDEAGEVYHRTRAYLAEQRGLDPGETLTSRYRAALRGTVGLPVRREAQQASGAPIGGLPRQPIHFVGRDEELGRVLHALRPRPGLDTPLICAIDGMAGVGKTALAVRAARRLADDYPDGCLFIDLHGYAAGVERVSPAEALDRLLRRLGVPGEQIPLHVDDRSALFRDRLSGRRILVLLDNAHDVSQLLPLLPAAAGCAVLVTSRDRLTALDDAVLLFLDVLPGREAATLFRSVIETERLAGEADPAALIDRIVERCGRLPLAIRIAAARYRADRRQTLASLDGRLDDEHARLAELDDGDRSVAASLGVSYADLPRGHRRTFALLATHPGTDVDSYAAAALVDEPVADADRVLGQLVDRHLLGQPVHRRYRLHDLVRVFARRYALPEVPDLDSTAGLRRLVDYYLCVADQADRTITPHRLRIPLTITNHPAATPDLNAYQDALAWLTTEQANLVGICHAAGDAGMDDQCWQLAYTLRGFFFLTKRWHAWTTTHELALSAARRRNDSHAEAITLNNLGLAAIEQGHLDRAAACYQQALRLFQQIGDAHGEHTALANHAWILFHRGRYGHFLRDSARALTFYQRQGARRNTAITLRSIALGEIEIGRTTEAILHLRQALTVFRQLDLRVDATMAFNGLGEAYRRLGDRQRAKEFHRRALEYGRTCGSDFERARAHHRLGILAADDHDHRQARAHWSQALEGYAALNAPQVAEVRARLAGLDG